MDLLGGYESDSDGEVSAAPASSAAHPHPHPHPHPAPSASDASATAADVRASPPAPSAAFLAEVAQATIAPDHSTALPPGQVREAGVGVRAETEDEKRDRKRAKKEAKKESKAAASASAASAKPKLVLPSAAALMSGVSLTAMGFGQSGNEADSEPSPPSSSAPRGPDGKPRYNALPPPASLLAGDKMSDAEAWRMRPMDMEAVKKRKFSDFPTPKPQATSSSGAAAATAPAAATAAAKPSASSSSAERLFAPPQVARSRANVSTEDVGSVTYMHGFRFHCAVLLGFLRSVFCSSRTLCAVRCVFVSNWSVAKRRSTGASAGTAAATDTAAPAADQPRT